MNQAERDLLGKLITATAMYFSHQITREVVTMMVDDLQDLPIDAVTNAYGVARRDPKNKFFPRPSQIREIVCPTPSPEAAAREAVERIRIAIGKFGYPDPVGAREFIGEVGWKIVNGMGGWLRVCQSDFLHNHGLLAQARHRAEDLVKFGHADFSNLLDAPAETLQIESQF